MKSRLTYIFSGEASITRRQAWYSIAFFWLSVTLFTGTLFSGFHFVDDGIYLVLKERQQTSGWLHTLITSLRDDLRIRFRPLSILYYNVVAGLFSYSFPFISFVSLLVATASGWAWQVVVAALFKKESLGLLFVMLLFAGNQGSIAYWIAVNENLGILFLGLAGVSITMPDRPRHRVYEILAFTAAALCKESFLLCAPGLMLLRYLKHGHGIRLKAWIGNHGRYLLVYFLVLAGVILMILLFSGLNNIGYAGIDHHSFQPDNIAQTAWRLLFKKGYGVPILLGLFILWKNRKHLNPSEAEQLRLYGLFYLLISLPQIVLYAKSQIFMRYLLPGLLGGSLFTICLLDIFGSPSKGGHLGRIFYFSVAGVLLINLGLLYKNAYLYAKEGFEAKRMFDLVSRHTTRDSRILLLANYETEYQPLMYGLDYFKSPLMNRPLTCGDFNGYRFPLSAAERTQIDTDLKKKNGLCRRAMEEADCVVMMPDASNHPDLSDFDPLEKLGRSEGFRVFIRKPQPVK